ncbi:type II toxin-antitoxin system PemK/MazF family toxin [Ammoniphilus sp. CFH 90114]|uniref:type II toxin-antitoxin system PemK/MazF family toxin n=1 Tax=Ammoniphilus sp. CFH 90114 TaxID=2493665 RepID=UPI00100FBAA7|nr:type II toxin-antitoxin system PemK/MazF family toxin [Ammoniphilus sp. CFH 90114]RXT03663.1 hypothetical protein EIZ39_23335 [Ammoniphilus sp. CFH 90114]
MKPGEIYDLYFPFKTPIKPGQEMGKIRPALILAVSSSGTALALSLKITGTGPTSEYPYRIPIFFWRDANLDKPSYVELDTEMPIRIISRQYPRGELKPADFNNVLKEYRKYKLG